MKFTLSPGEKKQLDAAVKNNSFHKWLSHKESMKFEIGDVLIKKIKSYDYKTQNRSWIVENINSDNKMSQRYVYVYEDKFGIGYMKQLKVSDGSLGKELFCVTDFDFDCTRFEVDPEYAEHVLLDAEFDIKSLHKRSLEARKIIIKMNRKIGFKPKTIGDLNKFFESLKPGDQFYTTQDFTGRYVSTYTFQSISGKEDAKVMEQRGNYTIKNLKEKMPKAFDTTVVYKIKYNSSYGDQEYNVIDLIKNVFYKTSPVQQEKK